MASAGFVAEFSKKSPAVKLGAFLVIVLGLGGLYYQLVYAKLAKDLDAAREQAVALNRSEDQTTKDEEEFEQLNGKDEERRQKLARFEQALPLNADVDAISGVIRSRAQDACKVEPLSMRPGKEVPLEDNLWKIPVEVTLECTFDGLKKFFYMIYRMSQDEAEDDEKYAPPPADDCKLAEPRKGEAAAPLTEQQKLGRRERVITIEDLQIVLTDLEKREKAGAAPAPATQAGAGPSLTATFKASAFRREIPEEEVAAAEAKDTKAKAGAGKGTAQQVKAKTEDAMEKSEERVDQAADKAGADKVKGGM